MLVHGEQNEMARLKAALIREYEDDSEYNIEVYNPRNTQAVELQFRGEKMAKVCKREKDTKLCFYAVFILPGGWKPRGKAFKRRQASVGATRKTKLQLPHHLTC